jgi:hypothetical protein
MTITGMIAGYVFTVVALAGVALHFACKQSRVQGGHREQYPK